MRAAKPKVRGRLPFLDRMDRDGYGGFHGNERGWRTLLKPISSDFYPYLNHKKDVRILP